jgi:hypothetical protein
MEVARAAELATQEREKVVFHGQARVPLADRRILLHNPPTVAKT